MAPVVHTLLVASLLLGDCSIFAAAKKRNKKKDNEKNNRPPLPGGMDEDDPRYKSMMGLDGDGPDGDPMHPDHPRHKEEMERHRKEMEERHAMEEEERKKNPPPPRNYGGFDAYCAGNPVDGRNGPLCGMRDLHLNGGEVDEYYPGMSYEELDAARVFMCADKKFSTPLMCGTLDDGTRHLDVKTAVDWWCGTDSITGKRKDVPHATFCDEVREHEKTERDREEALLLTRLNGSNAKDPQMHLEKFIKGLENLNHRVAHLVAVWLWKRMPTATTQDEMHLMLDKWCGFSGPGEYDGHICMRWKKLPVSNDSPEF